jgi:hypothetical protein
MKEKTNRSVNQAASLLGKRSAETRQKRWGKAEFVKKMREWGKLGGRPKKKANKDRKGKQ